MASSYVQVGYRFYQSAWKIDVKENPPSLGNWPNKTVHPYPPGQRVTILNVQPSEIPVDWTDWRDSSLLRDVRRHEKLNITSSGHVSLPLGTVPPVVDSLISLLGGFTVVSLIPQLLRQFGAWCSSGQPSNKGWIMINHRYEWHAFWRTHTKLMCLYVSTSPWHPQTISSTLLNGFVSQSNYSIYIYTSLLPSDPLITQMEVTFYHFHPWK